MQLDEREQQNNEDFNWCLYDPVVQRQYAGMVVAAHRRQIWGAGMTYAEAMNEARAKEGCPPKDQMVLVVVPYPMADDCPEYEWCLTDREVQRQYGGLIVAVHGRTVWGAGNDRAAAWDAARQQPGCPAAEDLAFVQVPYVLADDDLP
jgi:hypothetical protein